MKKIGIFLGADPGSGGMFQYSLSVLEALSVMPRDGHALVAAFFNPGWASYVEPLGMRALPLGRTGGEPLTFGRFWRSACLPIGIWRSLLWRFDPIARVLASERCHTWLFPAQDHWSYLVPVSAVVTIHDLMHRYEPQFPEVSRGGRYFAREYRFRNICRYAQALLVDSELGRKHVADCYGANFARLFALPYLPPSYIYKRDTPEAFDQRYRLPSRFLFYPAQFWLHKNHDRLLQALAIVRRSCPDVFLVLAGPQAYEYENLVRRVTQLGLHDRVRFTGYIPDVDLAEFYRRARALVMPTFFGPTNIPPLEAFVCSCPVAISNIYGMPEQVGDAAVLFDPLSIQAIAAAIESLWTNDDLCRRLVERGRQRVATWGQPEFSAALHEIMSRVAHLS